MSYLVVTANVSVMLLTSRKCQQASDKAFKTDQADQADEACKACFAGRTQGDEYNREIASG